MLLVLDSSVIVAALRQAEEHHESCAQLLLKIGEGQHRAIAPLTVLVEVVAAVRRRTGSKRLAERTSRFLQSLSTLSFWELTEARAQAAAKIAVQTGLRGMDALVVQLAQEFECPLVTLDQELAQRAQGLVTLAAVEEL